MSVAGRIRGNTGVLATLLVILALLFAAVIVATHKAFDNTMVAGALLGAAVSAAAALGIRLLSDPELLEVPRNLLEAARREVHDAGYYRSDCMFTVELDLGKKELRFSSVSNIVPTASGITIPRPRPTIPPPEGLKLSLDEYDYAENTIFKNTWGNKALEEVGERREHIELQEKGQKRKDCYKVVYGIQDGYSGSFKDEHLWTCSAADGFTVTAHLPSSYKLEVHVLTGNGETILPTSKPFGREGNYIYVQCVQRRASFSRQGFRWTIAKE